MTYLRRIHAAIVVAKSVGYVPEKIDEPDMMQHAIDFADKLTQDQQEIITNMLELSESEHEEMTDQEIDDAIAHINDWEDIIDVYEPSELAVIDSETGEVIDSDLKDDLKEDLINEVLSRAERLKAKVRFARTATKRERKAQIALKKRSSSATINQRARRLAVKTMERKLAKGKDMSKLSLPEKERIEKIIQRRSKAIGRMAMKLTSRIRSIEKARLSHAKFTK